MMTEVARLGTVTGISWETGIITMINKNHEWIYVISMPEKDKAVLEEICKAYNIKVEDLIRQFYLCLSLEG